MLSRNMMKRIVTTFTAIAVLCLYTNITFAQNKNLGEITVTGQVSVNGSSAVSSSTVTTDSSIVTGTNSSAIVSFGNNSKVELFANTELTLKFTNNSIVTLLSAGKIRITNAAGVGATVVTKSATVVADTGQANTFTVSLGCAEDRDCQDTFVETFNGLVVVIDNSDQTRKQVPAGTNTTVGDNCNQVCRVPGVLPIALSDRINPALLALIIGGLGAVAVAAIVIGGDNSPPPPNEPPVISPIA